MKVNCNGKIFKVIPGFLSVSFALYCLISNASKMCGLLKKKKGTQTGLLVFYSRNFASLGKVYIQCIRLQTPPYRTST